MNACANDDEAHWTSREWTKRMFWRSFSTVKSRSCESQSKCIQRDRQKRTSETSRKDVSWFGKRNENRKRTSTHQRTLHPKCDATNWSDCDECAQMADHVEQHRRWTTDGKERIAEIVWRFCCSFCFWSFAISLIRSLALARFFIIFNAWNVCVCARSFFLATMCMNDYAVISKRSQQHRKHRRIRKLRFIFARLTSARLSRCVFPVHSLPRRNLK